MAVTPSPNPKRILYVITKSNWGGAQRYVYDLAVAARKAGHTVLVAAGGEGELSERLIASGIAYHPIKSLGRDVRAANELAAFGELRRLFREWKPDVVHLNSSKAGIGALAARMSGVSRIVFTVHGWAWNEDRSALSKLVIACAYAATFMLCDIAIAVSEAARAQGKWLPMRKRNFHVIHNGIHPIDFLARADARSRLVPDAANAFWVGTIAELHPVKNLPVLIEAFEHLAPDFPDSELVIIGDGEERPALARLMKIEGVAPHGHIVGHVPQAATHLAAFDIFVLPSRSEGLAYVLLEAGQAGLPVVASNVGGIPEVIEHEKTGLLVPTGDREALTAALERLAGDAVLRERLARALREKVANEFSLEKMVEKTFALY